MAEVKECDICHKQEQSKNTIWNWSTLQFAGGMNNWRHLCAECSLLILNYIDAMEGLAPKEGQ